MSYTYVDITKSFAALDLIKHSLYTHFAEEKRLNPGNMHILEYLIKNPGCTQVELANYLMVTPASVTLATQRLEKAGLITKAAHSDNLRCKELFITDKGRENYEYNLQVFKKIDKILFCGFSESDIEQFTQTLERITENALKNCREVLSEKEFKRLSYISKNRSTLKGKDNT